MRQRELIKTMTTHELFEWMANDLSNDKEFKEKMLVELELERQKEFTAEQEAEAVRRLFEGMGLGNTFN